MPRDPTAKRYVSNFVPMELALAKYRLLFKHPFGTAHGLRDGTDSVFVRLSDGMYCGYGEATLPPYLPYDQLAVHKELSSIDLNQFISIGLDCFGLSELSPPSRAALSMAYYDLFSSRLNRTVSSYLRIKSDARGSSRSMVTLGISMVADIALKMNELPDSSLLKVKLGSEHDRETLERIAELDDRPLFLDANQGWDSVETALEMIAVLGPERIVGMEQPFGKDRWDLHRELSDRISVPIYGDESIQGLGNMERAQGSFSGVNLKLMKCGGLDVAKAMAERAKELGMRVMLGSMSESSLGCAAMWQLAGLADLLDLDGPWLISNDPFKGMGMDDGEVQVYGDQGIGVEQLDPAVLDWIPIGA